MINIDSASLFSSLFASQNPLARTAPPDAAEGDRNRSEDRSQNVRAEETVAAAALAYRRTERTALQIRTQEGDLVRLKFSVKDALSATASTREGDETVVSELSIRARSTTRLKISVQGDLNADELAAIQSVVEQAGALANQFFSGGTADAATLAGSVESNAEQLDQVRLRLSLRERLTYTQIGASPLDPARAAAQHRLHGRPRPCGCTRANECDHDTNRRADERRLNGIDGRACSDRR